VQPVVMPQVIKQPLTLGRKRYILETVLQTKVDIIG